MKIHGTYASILHRWYHIFASERIPGGADAR